MFTFYTKLFHDIYVLNLAMTPHAKNTTPVTMSAKQVETKHALKIIFHGFLG